MGWEESRYITVSMSDLIRIPEFIEIMKSYKGEEETLHIVDEEKESLLKDNGHKVVERGGEKYWVRNGIPVSAVKEFLVKYLEANPEKPVVVDFVEHRNIENTIVTCDRFWTFHKDAKYVDQELFDTLNEMQQTSHIQRMQENAL